MNKTNTIIDTEISILEVEMEETGKHVLKTETLRNRTMLHLHFDCQNEETTYLTKVGFTQAIQSRLYANGYRSVRMGLFVNLDRCEDILYLTALLKNEDMLASEKAEVADRIKRIRDKRLSGQLEFDISGDVINGIVSPPSEDEFIEMLNADAI